MEEYIANWKVFFVDNGMTIAVALYGAATALVGAFLLALSRVPRDDDRDY